MLRTAYEITATIITMAFCAFVAVVYIWPSFAAWLR